MGHQLNRDLARRTAWVPTVAIVIGTVLTVQVVRHSGIVSVDLRLRDWVADHQVRWLYHVLDVVTDVMSPPVEIVGVLAYFAWRHRDRLRPAAVAILGMQAVVIAIKAAIARPTPIHPSRFYGDYPSGHTAMFLTCAGVLILLSGATVQQARRWWLVTAIGTVAIMAAMIDIQGHWLSDTLASVCLAAIGLWLLAIRRSTIDR